MVIDEVQLAPELFRSIKVVVDADPKPGRFLLTGSVQVLALRDLPDAPDGRVIAIEVKAGATVRGEDLAGLRHLAQRLGPRLLAGYVLYTGQQTLPFGDRLRALPLDVLWHATP
jgi:AAA domain